MNQKKPCRTMVVLAALGLCLFSGCVTPPSEKDVAQLNYGKYPNNYRQLVEEHYSSSLFDPYSAHFRFSSPEKFWIKDPPLMGGKLRAGYFVNVWINAKNRFGGYVGEKRYGVLINNGRVVRTLDEMELQLLKRKD